MLVDGTIRSFLEALGSADPVPGGGSASALAASLAANLFKMVVSVTRAKEEDKRALLEPIFARVSALGDALTGLVDRDAAAYGRVRKAYGSPKDSDEQRIQRGIEIQLALREATTVPLEILERCLDLLEIAPDVVLHGRVSCISDAGTGNFLALSAAMGALLNVQVNLQDIDDEAFATASWARAAEMVERCQAGFEQARQRVAERGMQL